MPLKLKIRGRGKPVEGEIYHAHIIREPGREFIDSRTMQKCKSRDLVVVRLYVSSVAHESEGELRFFTYPLNVDAPIRPRPLFVQNITGVHEQGCLWVAEPEVEYDVRCQEQRDEVLLNEPVVVQIAGPEEQKFGSVLIVIRGMRIYDRRTDRLSSFARAEHIRRTVGRQTFEFVNLRDLSAGEAVENPPEFALTNFGFESIE